MDDEIRKVAQDHQAYLEAWLESLEQAMTFAPAVKQALEVKKWEVDALIEAPSTIDELPISQLATLYSEDFLNLKRSLPEIPQYNPQLVATALTNTVAGGTVTYNFVRFAGDLPEAQTKAWSAKYSTMYHEMQTAHGRSLVVRNLLHNVHANLAAEFDEIEIDFSFIFGQSNQSVAIKMRNVLEHYKGQLLEKAIKRPAEQKIDWTMMVERLCLAPNGSIPYHQMITQETTWRHLHSRLTEAAKNQHWKGGAATDITTLHAEFIDHLYTVLSLIKLS